MSDGVGVYYPNPNPNPPQMESAEAVRVFPLSNITFDAWRCDCPSAVDDVAAHPEGPFWTHRAVQPEWDLEQALGSQAMHVAGGWNGTGELAG